MIQNIWTVICRAYIVDQQTNNISLIDAPEEVMLTPHGVDPQTNQPRFPAVFNVVSLWGREHPAQPDVGQARLRFLSPAGVSLLEQAAEVNLRDFRRMRLLNQFLGFPLAGAGIYQFRVERRADANAEWEEVARVPLEVGVEEPPAAPRANGEAAQ